MRAHTPPAYLAEYTVVGTGLGSFDHTERSPVMVMG